MGDGDGGAVELALHISSSSGKLKAAAASIVTLRDRYSLRNRTQLALVWRQVC